jgi:hypothetical protein
LQSAAANPQVLSLAGSSGKQCRRPDRALTKPGVAPVPIDPNLARVIDAWPTLPEPIRRAILALMEAASARR